MSSRQRSARTPLSARFLVYYSISYLLLIGAVGWSIERQVYNTLIEDLEIDLEGDAELARISMPVDPDGMEGWAKEVFAASGLRVTVIGTDGVVVADSHSDPAVMENHGSRSEVLTALGGMVGTSSRQSETTGFEQHYLALPPDENEFLIRVSVSDRAVVERLAPIRSRIIWTSVVAGLVGVLIVGLLARRLARPIERIRDTTLAIAGGDLETRPERSAIKEIDDLGLSIGELADDLGHRLEQSELASETLAVVLGAIPQGTILFGPQDEVVYSNSMASRLISPIPERLSGLTPHPLQTAVRECRASGVPIDLVVTHGSPERRIMGMATPFSDDDRILLVLVDVTDRERAASVRRDFVADASHELKTPVSSIIASADALTIAVERGDDSALGFAANIESSARQLNRLVSELLDLSRLERELPELQVVQLDQLIRNEVARHMEQAGEAGVEVSSNLDSVSVLGSQHDLAIIFGNLIENAVSYTSEGGSVSVVLKQDDGVAVTEITDTGVGIPSRDLERIFERFYRVDGARSRTTGGTGLGLSIVKHSVDAHGGTVSAASELGVGSTFTVRLPLAP
jgi:two-component system phosphate regulon sensor histidine kinase PhoR